MTRFRDTFTIPQTTNEALALLRTRLNAKMCGVEYWPSRDTDASWILRKVRHLMTSLIESIEFVLTVSGLGIVVSDSVFIIVMIGGLLAAYVGSANVYEASLVTRL